MHKSLHSAFVVLALGWSALFPTDAAAVEPICPGGSSPNPNIIFCEDWDEGTPTPGFPNTRGLSWNGWWTQDAGGTEGFSELSTTVRHSGTRSLHQVKKASENAVRDQIRTFAPTSEIRIRFYVHFDASYANFCTGQDCDYVHFMFLQSALSGRGVRLDILPDVNRTSANPIPDLTYPWPPTCYHADASPRGYFGISSPSNYTGAYAYKGVTQGRNDLCFDVRENLQQWVLVEWAYKIVSVTEGRVSLWIDGVEMMRDELLPPDPDYMTIDKLILSGWMSTLRDYEVGFYIDDIVVAKNYDFAIGPIGSPIDTLAPAAPSNLQVQ
jgi:hypothetical protein